VEQTRVAQQAVASEQDCSVQVEGPFSDLAVDFKDRLGCPNQAEPVAGFFAEQPFERGYMYWSSILELFFVVSRGQWYVFSKAEVDRFNPNPDGVACEVPALREQMVQPIRGFGAIWCGRQDIRDKLGWATQGEFGATNNLLQIFEKGFILRDNQNRTLLLFNDGSYTLFQ
jgi:hypothetical protein